MGVRYIVKLLIASLLQHDARLPRRLIFSGFGSMTGPDRRRLYSTTIMNQTPEKGAVIDDYDDGDNIGWCSFTSFFFWRWFIDYTRCHSIYEQGTLGVRGCQKTACLSLFRWPLFGVILEISVEVDWTRLVPDIEEETFLIGFFWSCWHNNNRALRDGCTTWFMWWSKLQSAVIFWLSISTFYRPFKSWTDTH